MFVFDNYDTSENMLSYICLHRFKFIVKFHFDILL